LFLDDVSELSPGIQAKLLRVIQFGEFRRIGETKNRKIDVRIISSTNKDLKKEVEAKRFREDLYYRLKVMTIKLPPLRNRKEDIPLLVHHFVKKYGPSLNPKVTQINKEAMQVLKSYPWPGGVRELENIIQQILIVTQNTTIEVRNLPEELQNWYQNHKTKELPFDIAVEQFEKERIIKALEESNWNQSEAARKLKIPIPKIQRKIKKYKISKP
jgi:two-component system NtrC family response regulator